MSDVLEEFITLTPLTCVQQVNALLDAKVSKPRNCKVFYALFGVYCGVLVYRAYKTYSAKCSEIGDAQVSTASLATDNEVEQETVVVATPSQQVSEPSPILLQPDDFSRTDMRWRYGPPTASELKQGSNNTDEEETFQNEEPEVATVSVATSTMGKSTRTREDNIEGESPSPTTFSVGS